MEGALRDWKFLLLFIASFCNGLHPTKAAQGIDDILPDCALGDDTVAYFLYNRDNPDGVIVNLTSNEIPVIQNITTYFLVHGFVSEANSTDYLNLTHTLVEKNDVNVFSVDWAEGACSEGGIGLTQFLSFPSAVANTETVGEAISKFIKRLINNYGMFLDDIQLVGHSLGAQVVGFAGKHLQKQGTGKILQILGLDPAGPTFANKPCDQRICKTDAEFVQIFHTSYTLGTHKPLGHDDFYFNGGENQPSCSLLNRITCSHTSAIIYFTDIIRDPKCNYIGKKWNRSSSSIPKFNCAEDTCSSPGPSAVEMPARGTFYVDTSDLPDSCLAHS